MNRPVHFEIHAEEPEGAAKFYTTVFGWEIKKWGEFSGMDYWVIMTGKDEPGEQWHGIDGGLLKRMGPRPADDGPVNGYVMTITVADIDATITKIETNGGTTALPKAEHKGIGQLAYYKDTEGNLFGVLQPEVPAGQ